METVRPWVRVSGTKSRLSTDLRLTPRPIAAFKEVKVYRCTRRGLAVIAGMAFSAGLILGIVIF